MTLSIEGPFAFATLFFFLLFGVDDFFFGVELTDVALVVASAASSGSGRAATFFASSSLGL